MLLDYNNKKSFVCVNCGYRKNPSLVKVYKNSLNSNVYDEKQSTTINPTNLKLTDCLKCGQPVDFYLQMDNCLLILDAILIKTTFFRHIIHNCQPPKFLPLKLFIVYCFCETFKDWSSTYNEKISNIELESMFYHLFFKSIITNGIFFITIYLIFARDSQFINGKHFASSIMISSFSKLYKLPTTLWPSEYQNFIDILLEINLIACLIKCCTVSTHNSTASPTILLKLCVSYLITWFMRTLIITSYDEIISVNN